MGHRICVHSSTLVKHQTHWAASKNKNNLPCLNFTYKDQLNQNLLESAVFARLSQVILKCILCGRTLFPHSRKQGKKHPGIAVHTCNASTPEAEAGRLKV